MDKTPDIFVSSKGGVVIGNTGADISLDHTDEGAERDVSPPQSSGLLPFNSRIKGISLMVLVSVFATVHGAIVKQLKYIAVGEVIFIAGIYAVCFCSVVVSFLGVPVLNFPHKGLVFLRLFIGTVAYMGKVWSLQNLPLGDATALFFTSPLFTGVIARIFIKEKLTVIHIGAMIVGLCGVILIAKPSFIFKTQSDPLPWYYFLVPVLSAVFLSITYVLQRKIGTSVNSYTISWYTGWFQLIGGVLYHVITSDHYLLPPCPVPRVLLILAGLCVVVMFCAINLSLNYEKATTAVLIRNLDTALAFIVQVVLFGVHVETLSVVGAAMIMSGTVCLTLSKIFNVNCGIEF